LCYDGAFSDFGMQQLNITHKAVHRMYQLAMHHTYIGGSAFDISGKRNHGVPIDVAPGVGTEAGSYQFSAPTSSIMVPASDSLDNLGAVRIRMKIRTEPWDGQRRNLMEGFLSFAFVLMGDGRLSGGILDANGTWSGVTDSGGVTPGQWHEVELVHDGVDTVALKLDSNVVAIRGDVPGPVRSVGRLGIAIGRWPDANQYVFKGYIGEVQLWRFDPVRTTTQFLDCCCRGDARRLDDVLAEVRNTGVDWASAVAAARDSQQQTLNLVQTVRGASPTAAAELDELIALARLALLRRDSSALAALRGRAQSLVDATAGAAQRVAWVQRMDDIAEGMGFTPPHQEIFLDVLCLDVFAAPSDRPRPDPVPAPPIRGGPWDEVPTPESLTPPRTEPD
jgi:hypothetical protein